MCHTHDTRAIFSFKDLISPDLDLGLYLASASYLHYIFVIPSVAFWQGLDFGLAAVSGLISAAAKAIRVSFDP